MKTYNLVVEYLININVSVELPEGYTWDDIDTWYVKWDVFHACLKDGTNIQMDIESSLDDLELKRPDFVTVYNDDFSDEIDGK